MQVGKGGKGLSEDKKQLLMAGAAILLILIAGFMFYRNLTGGGDFEPYMPGNTPAAGSASRGESTPSEMGGEPGAKPGVSDVRQSAPSGPQSAAPPPSAQTSAPPQPAPAGAAVRPAPAPPAHTASTSADRFGMRQLTVFGTVNISYPQTWKIASGAGNVSAMFTDGKAIFEVLTPDPKADTAKAIAQGAVRRLAKGAAVTAGGQSRIAGFDAYWMAVRVGGKMARIVGIDASTRVVLFERVTKGDFAAYSGTFDKMQAGITFTR